jgi:V8-like Glu-specific endopeptidase
MGHKHGHRRGRRRAIIWSAATGAVLAGALAAALAPSALAQSQGHPRSVAPGQISGGAGGAVTTAVSPQRSAVVSADASAAQIQQFWTPARLAAATPVGPAGASPVSGSPVSGSPVSGSPVSGSPVSGGPAGHAAAGEATAGEAAAGKGAVPQQSADTRSAATTGPAESSAGVGHSYANSRPSIGILVYADKNLTTHYCTASVVQSPGKNLILTAAHCRPGYWVAFVPDYQAGAKTQPYGIWDVKTVYTDGHYAATGSGTDYDYAFAKVSPDSKGRLLQNVVGGNVLTRTPGSRNWAGVTGYPEVASVPADKAITCWNWTSALPGYDQLQFLCTGYYSGTSGSPWLIHLNSKTNTGDVIGVIGGLQYGGPNSWVSYSPVFDGKIFYLYDYALAH